MAFTDLERGDRVVLEIHTTVTGIVSRTWKDPHTEQEYFALRTEARGERVFRKTDIASQELVSRENEVPDRVGVISNHERKNA